MAGADVSAVTSGALRQLSHKACLERLRGLLGVINNTLVKSWQLSVVLSCLPIISALGVEHRKMKTEDKV